MLGWGSGCTKTSSGTTAWGTESTLDFLIRDRSSPGLAGTARSRLRTVSFLPTRCVFPFPATAAGGCSVIRASCTA